MCQSSAGIDTRTRATGDDARELNPDWKMAELIFGENGLSESAAIKSAISRIDIGAMEIDVRIFLKDGGPFFCGRSGEKFLIRFILTP